MKCGIPLTFGLPKYRIKQSLTLRDDHFFTSIVGERKLTCVGDRISVRVMDTSRFATGSLEA